ncbi:MAG: DUF4386 family protein [Anaerolineales bacterium]|nr:DUF4386 family protein [Anaerolineales bacterium]
MKPASIPASLTENPIDPQWKTLFYLAAFAAIYVIILIPIQGIIFIVSPPPSTVLGFFRLFHENVMIGLINLDLLLTIDYILVLFIYFVLFIVLSRKEKSLSLIATILGCLSITLYIVSREATFSMIALSHEYFAATTEMEKAATLAAGKTLLTVYNGSSFSISYVLGGFTMLLFSIAMLRDALFEKSVPITGLIMGVLMLVPPTVGEAGVWISMISLVPTLIWMILMSRWLFRSARTLAQ